MVELEEHIRARIKSGGPMTFAAFMQEALYHPGLGYYTSPETEIGRAGDFYTSPHLHPLFGAMLGRQAEDMWELMGRPPGFTIVEAGGGRGWLARDMMDYLKGREIYHALAYVLVEVNPSLAERQRALLEEHSSKVTWAQDLGDISPMTGLILSNELFDAMPVHLIQIDDDELKEIYVALEGDAFVESVASPSTPAIQEYLDEFGIRLPSGYRTEVNLAMRDWLRAASGVLKEGFILTIDYGYPAEELYLTERDRGTLLCYSGHQVNEDPLANIGGQDITAHINFSALKKWGEDLGLRSLGFTRQGPYLVALGIDEMITALVEDSPEYRSEISRIKGLIMPGGMGDTHKVLVQYRGDGDPMLRGFGMNNRLDSL
jgi:SAM-dependent MidA family methyltransferase